MADYFFYGSLMDSDVLSAVAGERIEPARMAPARLPGFARLRARDSVFPMIVAMPDEQEGVEGVLVQGLSAAAVRRLARYEGSTYTAIRRPVITAAGRRDAYAFVSTRPGRTTDEAWDFEAWRRRHKRRLLRTLLAKKN